VLVIVLVLVVVVVLDSGRRDASDVSELSHNPVISYSSSSSNALQRANLIHTQRLEASRFGAHLVTLATFVITRIQPKRAKSGGSRERLLASQLYRLR
jgi:hypothetical protein